MTPTGTTPDNRLLAALGPDVPGRLPPHSQPVDLEAGVVLLEPGATVWQVWFPVGGVVALGGVVREGTTAGLAVGREGAVGLVEALDGRRALGRATVLVPGRAWRLPVGPLRVAAKASPSVGRLCQGYAEALTVDALRSASCTPNHPADGRLARWLLHLRDRSGGAVVASSAEAFLTAMTGLAPAAVADGLRELERAGLIGRRGEMVEVVDGTGLEGASCDCYGVVRGAYDRLLSGAPG